MKQPTARTNALDVAAIAALAFIGACVSHEVLGHAGACLASGSRVALLTSVYFHCEDAGASIDLAGPLANLVLAAGACALLEARAWSARTRLFLVLCVAFNVFWLAGCMLQSAVANTSDFAYALRMLAISPPALGRTGLGIAGLLVYWIGLRATAKHAIDGRTLLVSYLAAGVVSCVAALCFAGPALPALGEAALESFGASVGLLLLAATAHRVTTHATGNA